MTLKNGSYFIRFVPPNIVPPFAGGSYATAFEIGHPIHVVAQRPPFNQVWDVKQVGDGKYLITIQNLESKIPGVGKDILGRVGFALNRYRDRLDGPIILGLVPEELLIGPTQENENVYSIRLPPQKGIIGVEYVVTAVDDMVFCQTKPVGFQDSGLWEFIPAN